LVAVGDSMANSTLKKEEGKAPYNQGYTSNNNTPDENILDSFQSLENEEASLNEQKEHLATLFNQLEKKAKEAVEKKKRRIERLNSEVLELKRRCEKFAICISTEPIPECSQTAP
jgi:predicted  nucleic acid-binding Zn-ribbon protein